MPICGAVIHLSEEPALRRAALDALSRDPRVTVGEAAGTRLPVVLDTPDGPEDDALWRDILKVDGVLHADVIVAALDDAARE